MIDKDINNSIEDKLIRMELLNARKSKKLRQQDIAAITGLSLPTISNIERGDYESGITLRSLIKYADAVGCKIFVKSYEDKDNG